MPTVVIPAARIPPVMLRPPFGKHWQPGRERYSSAPGFSFREVTIPSGVTVVGAGYATAVRSAGSKIIFFQKGVRGWGIRDLALNGEAQGKWQDRKDKGQCGIWVENSAAFAIQNITVQNFSGTGIHLMWFNGLGEGWGGQGDLDAISAIGNYVGIRYDIRAEYSNAQRLACQNNVIGCLLHGGNVKIAQSNFTSNLDGLVIEDKENGSHGVVSNCLMNHNERYLMVLTLDLKKEPSLI